MLDRNKLNNIRRAAWSDDWSVVSALYLDLSLEAAMDRFEPESLAPLVPLRDREKVIKTVDETFQKESREES